MFATQKVDFFLATRIHPLNGIKTLFNVFLRFTTARRRVEHYGGVCHDNESEYASTEDGDRVKQIVHVPPFSWDLCHELNRLADFEEKIKGCVWYR